MAVTIMKIQFRSGKEADLLADRILPGEPVYANDTNKVGIGTASGTIEWFATINPDTGKLNQMPTANDIGAIDNALKGVANGIATLNADGKVIQDPASIVDYVTEQGISGEWTYRKWHSGKIEAWARHSFESVVLTQDTTFKVYYAELNVAAPDVITSISYCYPSLQTTGYCAGGLADFSKKDGITYRLLSETNVNPRVVSICYYVIGK